MEMIREILTVKFFFSTFVDFCETCCAFVIEQIDECVPYFVFIRLI